MADTNRISESKKTSPLRMKPPLRSERERVPEGHGQSLRELIAQKEQQLSLMRQNT